MSDAVLSWTEERVELLGRLWGEGLSASQIAALLGGGVTRNAVIGKVHRLGLSGRAKTGQVQPARPGKQQQRPAAAPSLVDPAPRPRPAPPPVAAVPVPAPVVQPGLPDGGTVNIPVSHRFSIMELRETMCRWPLGDPQSEEFGFCGGRTATGLPYCVTHCRIAYQPAAERKRLRA